MPSPNDYSTNPAARLLKGAALLFAAIGGSMAAWGLDKWVQYPEARASQFGFEAPLWPAFTLFVALATGVVVWFLWSTARRVDEGEDLFAQRTRRQPSDSTDPSDRPERK
jgi:hypothetical protein